jgi:hypothetical protein
MHQSPCHHQVQDLQVEDSLLVMYLVRQRVWKRVY